MRNLRELQHTAALYSQRWLHHRDVDKCECGPGVGLVLAPTHLVVVIKSRAWLVAARLTIIGQ